MLVAGVIAWTAPCIVMLAQRSWNTDQGAHGPLILSIGLWMLWHEYQRHRTLAAFGRLPLALALLSLAATGFVMGQMVGAVTLLCLAAWAGMVAVLYAYIGGAALKKLWFPVLFFLFVIPPSYAIVGPATRALKLWLSSTAIDSLAALGYEVAVSGNALYIDQYELQLEAACAGLNSMVSLLAMGLFYAYLRRGSGVRYMIVLAALIIPVAIIANLVRVLALILLVHYVGPSILDTLLHPLAGFVLFFAALALLIVADAFLSRLPVLKEG